MPRYRKFLAEQVISGYIHFRYEPISEQISSRVFFFFGNTSERGRRVGRGCCAMVETYVFGGTIHMCSNMVARLN